MKTYNLKIIVALLCICQQNLCSQTSKKELYVETLLSNFPANGALSIDKIGNIHVSEYGFFEKTGGNGTRNFTISPTGKILDTITNLSGPMGNGTDSKGNFFINNDNNTQRGILLKINNKKREKFTEIPGWPSSMVIDKNDAIFTTNYSLPDIYKITNKGEKSVYISDERFNGSVGIDIDSSGNLIVANFATAAVYKIDKSKKITEIAVLKDIVVQNWGIGYITVVDNYIYATGIAVNKIFKISMDGEVTHFAGTGNPASKDGTLLEASFVYPNGIASDKINKILYISEYNGKNGVIRKIQL